jgi:hypothetical protein
MLASAAVAVTLGCAHLASALVFDAHLDRDGPLVRVHADRDPLCCTYPPDTRIQLVIEPEGYATSSWADPS